MALKKKERNVSRKSLLEAVNELSPKRKTLLAACLSFSVMLALFLFIMALVGAVTPEDVKDEEYETLLSSLDGRTWSIGKDEGTDFLFFPSAAVSARTERRGENLLLVFLHEEGEESFRFACRKNSVEGFIGSSLFTLHHSLSQKTGKRALTLISGGRKISLYEE